MTLGDTLYIANHDQIAAPETYNPLALVEEHKAHINRKSQHCLISKFETLFSSAAFTGCYALNFYRRRPFYSGLPWFFVATGLGYVAGNLFDKMMKKYRLQEWAVVEDYVKLHPEHFPAFPRRTFGEVLKPWSPFRNG